MKTMPTYDTQIFPLLPKWHEAKAVLLVEAARCSCDLTVLLWTAGVIGTEEKRDRPIRPILQYWTTRTSYLASRVD